VKDNSDEPLAGIRVVDFTTLVPGPMTTLALIEAGAGFLTIERPGGDGACSYEPKLGKGSAIFVRLNCGKRSLTVDLKHPKSLEIIRQVIAATDVLIEQFRPGVMARLGLGYEACAELNPGLIYCSLTGSGQAGPKRDVAGHDLNYVAQPGLLSMTRGSNGQPVLPHILAADIGGGAYPAIINILFALLQRERTGRGGRIDIAMSENVLPFLYGGLVKQLATGAAVVPNGEITTGGTARHQIYETKDIQHLPVAPIEDRFWTMFADAIGLSDEERQGHKDPLRSIALVNRKIASRTLAEWMQVFVATDARVASATQLRARGIFNFIVMSEYAETIALPVPIARQFGGGSLRRRSPPLDDIADTSCALDIWSPSAPAQMENYRHNGMFGGQPAELLQGDSTRTS
jgi:alpha-methylacyl-CoA racemase